MDNVWLDSRTGAVYGIGEAVNEELELEGWSADCNGMIIRVFRTEEEAEEWMERLIAEMALELGTGVSYRGQGN
jgi:hypothetical protein